MDDMTRAVAEGAMRLGRACAYAVDDEAERLLSAGQLVSHVASMDRNPLRTLIMSGNLVVSEVAAIRDGMRFRIVTVRYGDGVPLEDLSDLDEREAHSGNISGNRAASVGSDGA